jgi:hypothetical protein
MLQLFIFILMGTVLLWFGYSLFFGIGKGSKQSPSFRAPKKTSPLLHEGIPGAPKTCPVCSARLERGERVKSSAFPAMGGTDRLMYIAGCPYCLSGQRERHCPVCGATLKLDQVLIARLFDKPTRSHVHVLGCSQCRGQRTHS